MAVNTDRQRKRHYISTALRLVALQRKASKENSASVELLFTECSNRARSIFSTLRKARRVLKRMED